MFDNEIPQSIPQDRTGARSKTPPANLSAFPAPTLTPSTPHKNLFSYSSPTNNPTPCLTPHSHSRRASRGPNLNPRSHVYSLSPVKYSSQTMLLSPRKTPRPVSKVPYKVLDAPELADDFYLNLVDWGAQGVLAVGLGESVYLWNSESGKVEQLCRLDGDSVTSVGWIQRVSRRAPLPPSHIRQNTSTSANHDPGFTSRSGHITRPHPHIRHDNTTPPPHNDGPYLASLVPILERPYSLNRQPRSHHPTPRRPLALAIPHKTHRP